MYYHDSASATTLDEYFSYGVLLVRTVFVLIVVVLVVVIIVVVSRAI